MQVQSNKLNFKGENIYVGVDVHLKSWSVTILTENNHHKTFNQPPQAETLAAYLQQHFPQANYYSAYEAGFSPSLISWFAVNEVIVDEDL